LSDPITTASDAGSTTPAAAAPTLLGAADAASQAPAAGATDATAAQPAAQGDSADAGDTTGDGQADKPADADKPAERAAPEKYEFTAPEGTALDAEVLAEFEGAARELGMPQAEAQALVDKLAPKIAARAAAAVQAQQAEAVAQISAQWADSAQADKEIGGDALPQSLAHANRALKQFGTPELRSLLEDSKLGNHPEVLRFLARAGKATSEDTAFMSGKATGAASKTLAERLYPTATH